MNKLNLLGTLLAVGVACSSVHAADKPNSGKGSVATARWDDPVNKVTAIGSPVIVCLNKANPASGAPSLCDYGPLTPGVFGSDLELNLIATGSVTVTDPIVMTADGKAPADPNGNPTQVRFSLAGSGTGCPVRQITGSFWDRVTVSADRKQLSWKYDKDHMANFGKVCGQNNDPYTIVLSMTLYTQQLGSAPRATAVTFTNSKGVPPRGGMIPVPDLQFQFVDR